MPDRSPLSSHSSEHPTEETKRSTHEAKPLLSEVKRLIPESEEKGPSAKYKYLQQYPRSELYRLIVDGQFHAEQTGWLGYESREPGCMKAAFDGLQIALTDLSDTNLSIKFIEKLHWACTRNVKNILPGAANGGIRRFSHDKLRYFVGLTPNTATPEGVKATLKWMSEHKHDPRFLVETFNKDGSHNSDEFLNRPEHAEYVWNRMANPHSTNKDFSYRVHICAPKSGPHVDEDIKELLSQYQESILKANTRDEKLSAMVDLIWELDRLHPFKDGNTRTFTICLLNRLLAQNGFPPPTFEVPNQFFGYSKEQMLDQLKKAIRVSEEIIAGKTDSFEFETSDIPEKFSGSYNDISRDFFKHIQRQDRTDDQYKAELKNCFIADLEQCKKMGKANKFFHFFSFSNQDRIDASNKMIGLLRGKLTAKDLTSKDMNVLMEPKSYQRRLISEYEKLGVLPKEFTEALAEKTKKFASEFDKRAFSRGFRRD